MVAGVGLLVGGVAILSRAAAAIILGLLLMAWAYVTARPKST